MSPSAKPVIAILCGYPLSHNMDTVLYNLARMLENSFELVLMVGQDRTPQRLTNLFHIRSHATDHFDISGLRYARKACHRLLAEMKPDILMSIGQPHVLGYVVSKLGRSYGVPTIVRATGDTFNEARFSKGMIRKFRKWILHHQLGTLAYRRADLVVAVGNHLKEEMIKHGINADKIVVVPQPFDNRIFSPVSIAEKITIRQRLGLSEQKKVVLFVGRLSWLKGADRLMEIVNEVACRSNRFQFCFVGAGEYYKRLRTQYDPEILSLPGSLPHEQISDYYKAADLFIFPSRIEGLPNTILEAISCRLPIIASPVGEIPQYVRHVTDNIERTVQYILDEEWPIDPVPEWFQWDKQQQIYQELFRSLLIT